MELLKQSSSTWQCILFWNPYNEGKCDNLCSKNSIDSRWVNTNFINHSNHKMGDSINEFKIKKTLDLVLLQLAQQNQNQIEISIRYTNGARMLSLVQLMNYRITSEENCELFKNCSLNLLQSSFKNFVLGTHQLIRFSHSVQRREDVTYRQLVGIR